MGRDGEGEGRGREGREGRGWERWEGGGGACVLPSGGIVGPALTVSDYCECDCESAKSEHSQSQLAGRLEAETMH